MSRKSKVHIVHAERERDFHLHYLDNRLNALNIDILCEYLKGSYTKFTVHPPK